MYSGLKCFKIFFAVDFHLWSGDGTKRLMHILGILNKIEGEKGKTYAWKDQVID